ncbi:MAG: rhomboid family intramembrane serine protease [Planctomycetota bacterium]|nr:MAG: rhomboid family intramembrane serine protease [Planctomycetota bacterium]
MSESRSFPDRILESPITWLVTAINLGVFTIAFLQGEHRGESLTGETLITYGAVERYRVWNGDYWRLATAMFLHIGWIHLLWNTWAMFSWCAVIERTVGSAWFAFAYLTTGIGACALSVLGHHVLSVGASGAGFGMSAVILSLLYRREGSWNAFIASPTVKNILVNTGIWIAIGFAGLVRMDNYAHLGGFALGIPCGLLLGFRRSRNRTLWIAGLAAYILGWLALVVIACIPGMAIGDKA